MKKKHTGKIVILMILLFISSYGSNLEALYRVNMEFEQAGGYAFLYSVLGLCGSAIIAMIIPFVCRLINGRKLPRKWGILICVANSIVAFVVSTIIQEQLGILLVGGIGAIIYFFINKWLFVLVKDESINIKQADDTQANDKQVNVPQMSLSSYNEKPAQNSGYAIRSEDVKLERDSIYVHEYKSAPIVTPSKSSRSEPPTANEKVRYCSRCGGRVDNSTKRCTGCGRQYFKGATWRTVVLILIVIVLTIALVFVGTRGENRNGVNQGIPEKESTTVQTTPAQPRSTPSSEPYYKKFGLTQNEYKLARIVAHDEFEYCKYMGELIETLAKGTYSDELKIEVVVDSLNNHDDFEYGEKIILYRFLFPYDNEYNDDIVEYLNERDDVTYEEMEFVLKELGFAVFEDGTVQWD